MKYFVVVLLGLAASLSHAQDLSKPEAGIPKYTADLVQPLMDVMPITFSNGRSVDLEPGLKATRIGNGYTLSTYDGRKIELVANGERIRLASPLSVRMNQDSLDFGTGRTYSTASVFARLSTQDDTDSNLKSMQESAKKLKAKSDNNQDNKGPAKKMRVRRLYGEDPNPTAELFNSAAIQQLTHLSHIGF